MAEQKKKNTAQICTELAAPVAEQLGLELWDVRFEKEGAQWYLRYYIDKPGLTIEDCEAFSRAMDPVLDEADPIAQSYCLEVSSPGVQRRLLTDAHFARYVGSRVEARFYRAPEGYNRRDFVGVLKAFDAGQVLLELEDGAELSFPKSDAARVKLYFDFDRGGQGE